MNESFEQVIDKLVADLSGSSKEKLEIEYEVRDHLYSAYEHYLTKGLSEELATKMVLSDFGQLEHISTQYQQVINPIYGWIKKLAVVCFAIYSILVIWKILLSRLLIRIIEYTNATGPSHLQFVFSNPHDWVEKQFFDFSLWESNINLTPLKMIIFYAKGDHVANYISFNNLIGNIILLLPLGLALPFIFKKCTSLSVVTTIAFITSIVIEVIQFTLQIGMADIDDVILNTIGAMIGFGIGKLIIQLLILKINWKRTKKVNLF